MAGVTTSLNDFPEHQAIIGRIVIGYSELETDLIGLVSIALNIDLDDAVRLIYRARSESQRVNISDAALRPFFERIRLAGPYSQFLGAIKRCKDIRNNYAHSIWYTVRGQPAFVSLDDTSKGHGDAKPVHFKQVDLDLLTYQETFFAYTEQVAFYLKREARFRKDRRRRHATSLPRVMRPPKLHNPQT